MTEFVATLIIKGIKSLDDLKKGLTATLDLSKKSTVAFDGMANKVKKVDDEASKLEKRVGSMKKMFSGVPGLSYMTELGDKFKKVNDAAKEITKGPGNPAWKLQKGFREFFTDFSSQGASFAKNLNLVFGKGLSGMLNIARAGLKGLMVGFRALLPIIGSIAFPITAIIAAILVLRRMWQLNVGGMQTQFFRVVGALKDIWAKLMISFDTTLRKLGPLFRIIFGILGAVVMPIIAVIGALFTEIFNVIGDIAGMIGDAFKPIADLFGGLSKGNKQLNIMSMLFKAIGIAMKIAFLPIRLALIPFQILFKILGFIWGLQIKIAQAFGKWMMSLKPVQAIIAFVKGIIDNIIAGINKVVEMGRSIPIVGKAVFGEKKEDKINRKASVENVRSDTKGGRTTYNQQQVNIHSSGEISPQNAPMIGDSIAGSLQYGSRVGG